MLPSHRGHLVEETGRATSLGFAHVFGYVHALKKPLGCVYTAVKLPSLINPQTDS